MNERLTELLPWYVNGSLNAQDRAWVDDYLSAHPESRGELEWYIKLQQQIHETSPLVSDEIGLARAMARIEAEKTEIARASKVREDAAYRSAAQPATRLEKQPATREGLFDRMRGWMSSWSLRPAMGVALAVIAVQSVMLVRMGPSDDEASAIRAVRPVTVEQGPVIKINFKADTTEADIRLLLIEVQGTMAGGPGQLGDWYVKVPASRVDAALASLKASRFVESSAVLDAVPARD